MKSPKDIEQIQQKSVQDSFDTLEPLIDDRLTQRYVKGKLVKIEFTEINLSKNTPFYYLVIEAVKRAYNGYWTVTAWEPDGQNPYFEFSPRTVE